MKKILILFLIGMVLSIGIISATEADFNLKINCYNCISDFYLMIIDEPFVHAGYDPYDFPMPPSPSSGRESLSSTISSNTLAIHSFNPSDLPRAINLTYQSSNLNFSWNELGKDYTVYLIDYGDDPTYQNQVEAIDMTSVFSYEKDNAGNNYFLIYMTKHGSCNPPFAGHWAVDCSNGCVWTEPLTLSGNLSLVGNGKVILKTILKFINPNWEIFKKDDCTFEIMNGGELR